MVLREAVIAAESAQVVEAGGASRQVPESKQHLCPPLRLLKKIDKGDDMMTLARMGTDCTKRSSITPQGGFEIWTSFPDNIPTTYIPPFPHPDHDEQGTDVFGGVGMEDCGQRAEIGETLRPAPWKRFIKRVHSLCAVWSCRSTHRCEIVND